MRSHILRDVFLILFTLTYYAHVVFAFCYSLSIKYQYIKQRDG